MRQIVVGTRGSTLALAQARWVVARLKEEWPETEFRLSTIPSRGDTDGTGSHADNALATNDLERALSESRIDIAVHNLKDMPVEQPDGLEIASIPRRVEAREALIGRQGCKSLAGLPAGSVVGTTGARRLALLRAFRPDLTLRELSGDVDARLEVLGRSEVDALVLAAAGLIRLDQRHRIDEFIDPELMLPTPGQGALALEARSDDDIANELAYSLHHHASDDRTTAERAFLAGLKASPTAPIGALATVGDDGVLTLVGCVAALDGSKIIRASVDGDAEEAEDLGRELAEDVLSQGGAELLASG
ncbi:MAG TPA: hydroxymethylbilane synthase [Deinococcales bacterium]|nr:hydroxymethylbilane synthase [Deinococcales bacterium]